MYTHVHTFFKGISPNVSVLAWQEFERAYYNVAVQYFCHNVTGALNYETSIKT